MKKLEELLSRCKDSMKAYKERIEVLTTENDGLQEKLTGLEQEEVRNFNFGYHLKLSN